MFNILSGPLDHLLMVCNSEFKHLALSFTFISSFNSDNFMKEVILLSCFTDEKAESRRRQMLDASLPSQEGEHLTTESALGVGGSLPQLPWAYTTHFQVCPPPPLSALCFLPNTSTGENKMWVVPPRGCKPSSPEHKHVDPTRAWNPHFCITYSRRCWQRVWQIWLGSSAQGPPSGVNGSLPSQFNPVLWTAFYPSVFLECWQ